jgi:protein-S-isoprenylcysteine O-methyltransferase Ste14
LCLACDKLITGFMFLFLIPLLLGFALMSASSFTAALSRSLGERRGRLACVILRNFLGAPLLLLGIALAVWQSSGLVFRYYLITDILGWLLLCAGGMIILAALTSLRLRSVSPSMKDTLVSEGLYSYVRHPLYDGVILEFLGLALISPTRSVMLTCALVIVWMVLQTFLEETDLLQRVPGYREYRQRVPRLIPFFRRKTPAPN